MTEAHATVRIEPIQRAASWWRAAGFPVPPNIPDEALGSLHNGTITFTWVLP